jgi:hypothetical protein
MCSSRNRAHTFSSLVQCDDLIIALLAVGPQLLLEPF